jgi:hypothetical protein
MDITHTLPADGPGQFSALLPEMPDNGKAVARLHFDSLAAMAKHIPASAPASAENKDFWTKRDPDFYGPAHNMAAALTLARDGWQEGADRAIPLLERVKISRPTRKALARYDVAGATPNVARYLAGNPLCMRQPAQVDRHSPVITLLAPTQAPWNIPPRVFEAGAVAALAIVDRLEDAGIRVEILAGRRESSESEGTLEADGRNNRLGYRSEIWARLKSAGDALDLPRVAFGLGHPAVHRRLFFGMGEMHPAFKKSLIGMQGYAIGMGKLERPHGVYVLPGMREYHTAKVADPVAAFDHAIAFLKSQACPGL